MVDGHALIRGRLDPGRIIAFLCTGALGVVFAAGCDGLLGEDESAAGGGWKPTVSVEVHQVIAEPFSDMLVLVGELASEESVVVRPEVAGIVQSIRFEEGQRVAKHAVLFSLRADLERAAVREERANVELARVVFDRTGKLSQSQIAAASELDEASAKLDAARAVLERAEVSLERMSIRAPFDGAVGARSVSPGDRVDVGTALVRIDALERLQLRFSLPETAVRMAAVGQRVGVEVAPFPDERFVGEVYFVSPTLDPDTRRLPVKAWVANEQGRLSPGLFARVFLETRYSEAAIAIPEAAVVYDANGSFVWRISAETTAERIPVDLGRRHEGRVLVQRGLAVGDAIVSAGTHKVYSGSALAIVEARESVATGQSVTTGQSVAAGQSVAMGQSVAAGESVAGGESVATGQRAATGQSVATPVGTAQLGTGEGG